MAWLMLFVAGVFEVAWAVSMKSTEGWTRLRPSLVTLGLMAVSFYLLSRAMLQIPIGTAYAVWTGIGSVGVAALGILIYKEPLTALRLLFIAMIVAGIVGLKVVADAPTRPAV